MHMTYGFHVFSGKNLFAYKKIQDPVVYKTELNQTYALKFIWARECDLNNLYSPKARNASEIVFLNICVKSIMRDSVTRSSGGTPSFTKPTQQRPGSP